MIPFPGALFTAMSAPCSWVTPLMMANLLRAAGRFLLSGLAHCGYCDNALIGQDAKSGSFSYYVCGTLGKKGAGSCQRTRSADTTVGR